MGRNGRNGDGLKSKVISLRPSIDAVDDRYFPMCSHDRHYGFIADERVCQTRRCQHYNMLFVESGKNVRPYVENVETAAESK